MEIKSKKFLAIVFLSILNLFIVGCNADTSSKLSEEDKMAYEFICEAAYNFKNPSSVRVISGTVEFDIEQIFVRLSAQNGFGGTTDGYYWIAKSSDGGVMCFDLENEDIIEFVAISDTLKKEMIASCDSKDSLNLLGINNELAKNWGN